MPKVLKKKSKPKKVTCGGKHRCPVCKKTSECAFELCGIIGAVKCDYCLLVEAYGPKAAEIAEKAIGVAYRLWQMSGKASDFITQGTQPWKNEGEARAWANSADDALEELDSELNRFMLRLADRRERAGHFVGPHSNPQKSGS